jgi:hypothetical protein
MKASEIAEYLAFVAIGLEESESKGNDTTKRCAEAVREAALYFHIKAFKELAKRVLAEEEEEND